MGKDTKKNFLDSWKNKYRFVVLTEDTFEEKFSVNSSKTGVFVFLCFMLVFLVGGHQRFFHSGRITKYALY